MNNELPSVGQKVFYVDNRETHGFLTATVTDVNHDTNSVELIVRDINVVGGYFTVLSSNHDEAAKLPGTWHYPR